MANNKFQALGVSDDSDVEEESKTASAPQMPLEVPPGEHRLQSTYCLWFSRKVTTKRTETFSQSLIEVGRFATVEQFWRLYCHLVRVDDISAQFDFHLFKEGIKPMWEDEANRFGGKWIVRLRKGLAARCWENLILAMMGEQFMVGEEICGVVVAKRVQEDLVSIWNRTASDYAVTSRIRDTFRRVMNLPPATVTEYKPHRDSIK